MARKFKLLSLKTRRVKIFFFMRQKVANNFAHCAASLYSCFTEFQYKWTFAVVVPGMLSLQSCHITIKINQKLLHSNYPVTMDDDLAVVSHEHNRTRHHFLQVRYAILPSSQAGLFLWIRVDPYAAVGDLPVLARHLATRGHWACFSVLGPLSSLDH